MNYKIAQKLSLENFKRRFGVHRATFKHLVKALKPMWRATSKPGVKPKLALADRVLVCLEYWREYRTYFHIGSSWGVSESTVCRIVRWVEDQLIRCGQFRLTGKKQLVRGFAYPQVVVMDVTETPIERPKRRQRQFYSGKKKRHTLKCQIVLEPDSGQIICTFFGKGRRHDFKLYQASGVRFASETEVCNGIGYQGIQKLHPNSRLPHKKPRGGQLSATQKADNRALARRRVVIEQVKRCLKIFRILAERYRNRRRRFGLRCNLIAALYNYERSQATCRS
ncbi:IS5 family transposase [Nostoc sp.]|uniref:IS5 family transposase n=1 Tax=Nostoc sp. TaxID=1180 RepID=UPI0035937808